jgi:hypothetical protein
VVAVAQREQPVAALRACADRHRRERLLTRPQAQPLHLGVGAEEALPERVQESLRRGAVVLQRVAQDHVLHRVGGDDVRVVAFGVGGEEALPEHLHAHVERQQPGVERTNGRLRDRRQAVQGRHPD